MTGSGTKRDLRLAAARREALDRALARLDAGTRRTVLELVSLYAEVSESRRDGGVRSRPPAAARGASGSRRPRPLVRRVARRLRLVAPADNVLVCVAQLLARTGASSFTVGELREQASRSGLGLPARPGARLAAARREGRALFRHEGGRWRLSAAGARHFRSAYGVRRSDPPPPLRAHG